MSSDFWKIVNIICHISIYKSFVVVSHLINWIAIKSLMWTIKSQKLK